MDVQVSREERAALVAARAQERRARVWRRYRALELLDDGQAPAAVAAVLGCCPSRVYNWLAAWRRDGLVGLTQQRHAGGPRRLTGAPEERLEALVGSDPQAAGYQQSGWTVPLLQAELAKTGTAVSERTIRRALDRRGWRFQAAEVRAGAARSRLRRKQGAVMAAVAQTRAAGGAVWVGEQMTLRELVALASGLGAPERARHGGDQRPESATGVVWSGQSGDGRARRAGAGTPPRGGQRGLRDGGGKPTGRGRGGDPLALDLGQRPGAQTQGGASGAHGG